MTNQTWLLLLAWISVAMAQTTTTCSVLPLGTTLMQGDPCYWDGYLAADCGNCFDCYAAGGDTCDATDCAAYRDCLDQYCEGCEDLFMYYFICKDNYYQCKQSGVRCSVDGYNTASRALRIDHHHGRDLARRRKGIKDTSSISK